MLIAPGAVAFLLTRRFSLMLALAVVVATTSSFLGLHLSFFIDSTIVRARCRVCSRPAG